MSFDIGWAMKKVYKVGGFALGRVVCVVGSIEKEKKKNQYQTTIQHNIT